MGTQVSSNFYHFYQYKQNPQIALQADHHPNHIQAAKAPSARPPINVSVHTSHGAQQKDEANMLSA